MVAPVRHCYGDTVSSIGYPNGGVPQGTLSGPKNFLVQINDLQTPCPMFKYVDDSTVFDVCNNSSVPMLQESADIITDWSRNNDMRINAIQTKETICFCRNDNHVASIPRIVIDNNDIARVTQAKVQTCAGIRMPGMAYEPSNVFVKQH